MLKERIDKAYPRGALKVEEERSLSKLEAIAAKLKCGKKLTKSSATNAVK